MIEFIKCNYADEEYLKKHKIFSTADVYFIIKNNERCGAIEYRETYEFSLKIEYLLVFPEQAVALNNKTNTNSKVENFFIFMLLFSVFCIYILIFFIIFVNRLLFFSQFCVTYY